MKHLILFTLTILLIAIILVIPELPAQPPGLPSTPSQAPIDGGLGILAFAGGAYAVKKLRDKKSV